MTPEEAAIEAGAMQLGEESPEGRHWIFSEKQLERFAELVRAEPRELPPLPY